MNKTLDSMSAEELYELARQREAQEKEHAAQERREQLEALQVRRKDMMARQAAELAAIDKDIQALGGRTAPRRKATAKGGEGRGNGNPNLSRMVVEIINEQGEMSTKALKSRLASQGVETRNISQTLAYLKRNGRLRNTGRGIYAAA
ncbi:hypothetical protein [Ectothiorhodospira lacustris]|uniref:hypothetical protein n=1 Tax=Ectothiorhodospira lacustris TaxID=2899127 RepID=UPI001EE7D0E7|nr:hypothetical protein [Ectothiorhodospira lacustris]MCG5500859.1 hypothetical protein [Ectothiorhodospira lacustris]MCG5511407.1 hypothetical protein [Ectothiorhodospira lacustris]MCG5523192.1 hypothetical protein [Ectothiorhodospira lacustris]